MTGLVPLVVVGCDFRTASSRWRSRLALTEEEAVQLGKDLRNGGWADGLVVLDTCNRNEWIVSSRFPDWTARLLVSRMKERLGPEGGSRIQPAVHIGSDAVRHVLRVAVGLESLVTGERQIASQLFAALDAARDRGDTSRVLNGLGSVTGRLVRSALRDGLMGCAGAGVHGLAIQALLKRLDALGRQDRHRVAVVGMGSIGRKLAGLLDSHPRFTVIRVNRTPAPPAVQPLGDLPDILPECDGAVFCTAARTPAFTPADVPPRERPFVLVDIGIPEQVERKTRPGIEVLGLDDLVRMHRPAHGKDASDDRILERVDHALEEFQTFCALPPFAGILDVVRRTHRRIAGEALPTLLEERLGNLEPQDRSAIESALRSLLTEYTTEVIQTIRDASLETGESPCPSAS